MENGKNIIKDVIKNSGIMIPEFFAVAQKAFTRIDLHEPGRPRKEINEEKKRGFLALWQSQWAHNSRHCLKA